MKATNPNEAPRPRSLFALTGPSRPLDPRTQAVRKDIADVRLAAHVFAPHYAEPVARIVECPAVLREARGAASTVLAALAPGETFEVLDLMGGVAWGIACAHDLVGYVDATALGTDA